MVKDGERGEKAGPTHTDFILRNADRWLSPTNQVAVAISGQERGQAKASSTQGMALSLRQCPSQKPQCRFLVSQATPNGERLALFSILSPCDRGAHAWRRPCEALLPSPPASLRTAVRNPPSGQPALPHSDLASNSSMALESREVLKSIL